MKKIRETSDFAPFSRSNDQSTASSFEMKRAFMLPTGRKRGFFTLIELLVVIAIIAILAAMLMPALNKARDTSRTIGCINNLRQLAMAVFSYDTDYKQFPLISSTGNANTGTWGYDLCRTRSVKNKKIMFCPLGYINTRKNGSTNYPNYARPDSAKNIINYPTTVYLYRYSGFGMNNKLGQPGIRVEKVKTPSRKVLIGDADDLSQRSTSHWLTPQYAKSASPGKRHASLTSANICWVDGHAGTVKRPDYFLYCEKNASGKNSLANGDKSTDNPYFNVY